MKDMILFEMNTCLHISVE